MALLMEMISWAIGRGRRHQPVTRPQRPSRKRRGPPREHIASPQRPPRVTDDDNDGLAGALVPRTPLPQNLSGAAALHVPADESAGTAP